MKMIQTGARIVLGLIYTVFGGMGLAIAFGLMQMPEQEPMPEAAMGFMQGMMGTGYFFQLLKLTETVFGFLLLIGVVAPAALVILAPVTLNIFLFHAFLTPTPGDMALSVVMVIAHIIAMSAYWDIYQPLFQSRKKTT
ncbi:MAG: acyltransferase [Candidatus Omnitrophica bacterium]|nr:acyltransferase [Candidatus Omnitrophota bacterium]